MSQKIKTLWKYSYALLHVQIKCLQLFNFNLTSVKKSLLQPVISGMMRDVRDELFPQCEQTSKNQRVRWLSSFLWPFLSSHFEKQSCGCEKTQMKPCCFASNRRLLFQAKEDAARLSAWVPWHSTSTSTSSSSSSYSSCVVSQTQLHILWGEVRSRIFGEVGETKWARVCL